MDGIEVKGNNPENQNLAVWFCVRPGPTPFLAFGTPARFRVVGAASCGHHAAGAAGGEKKLSPTTTNLVCDSREFATRSTSTPSSPIPRVTKVSSAERKATSGRGGEIFSVSADFYIA